MLSGRCGEPQFTMCMLADLPTFEMADLIQCVPAAERSDPVLAIAKIVATTALHDPIGIGFPPQALVHTERHADTGAQIEHVLDRIDPHRRFDEIEVEPHVPSVEGPDGLGNRPRLIDVDTDFALWADRSPQ